MHTTNTMKSSIDERLASAEEDLLHAAATGGTALVKFHDSWAALLLDMEHEVQTSGISENIMNTRSATATRLLLLSEQLFEFQVVADDMSSKLHDELEIIFSRVNVNAASDDSTYSIAQGDSPPTPSPSPNPPPDRSFFEQYPRAGPSSPPYIELAYKWLLNNLHNPYPTKGVKDSLSSKAGCNRSSIDAWFIDVRKRIGWNCLRKQQFSNKRVEIVDAATRFFIQQDSSRILDPNLGPEFVAIENAAKDLYAGRYGQSTLAAQLDSAVKDMTPEMKAQARAEERHRRQEVREAKDRAMKDAQVASYPSPNCSPSGTPEPVLPLDEPDLSVVHPMSATGRKRASSSQGSPVWHSELSLERPDKRLRFEVTQEIDAAASLPSPALSHNNSLPSTASPSSTVHRKRRLSDGDSQGAPKRPRNILSGPRLHAVSDPLPSPAAFSAWFESSHGIPRSATIDKPDISLPFDIELFDYSDIDTQANSLPEIMDSMNSYYGRQELAPSSLFEKSLPAIPAFALDISTNDFDFDELFREDVISESFSQHTVNEFSIPPFDPPVLGFNFTRNSVDHSTALLDTAVIVDSSTPILQRSTPNFDWMFPPLTPSQNEFDSLQGIGLNISSQEGTPEFDPLKTNFSITDFSNNNVSHLSAEADKAAKQRKLMEMKEATRRLEAEIAAS